MKKIIILLVAIFFTQNIISQNPQSENCPCCSESYKLFDFWIGNWTVYDVNDKVIGTNTIDKLYDGCVLQEKWNSSTNNRGTSYNYYDKNDSSWNQVWIDNSGFTLVLKGNYSDGKMILKSELQKSENGNFYNQITWVKNDDGTVTQIWDVFNEKGIKTKELFRGKYKKSVKTFKN
ncbi:hypothetical protein [Aureibaculum conchae]|uniref:hypothetical protein n=1 Tax=Aureibaculum sp. 2308TA14-22 TaxID=3108392 RepID=UPI0033967329